MALKMKLQRVNLIIKALLKDSVDINRNNC